MLVTIKSKLFAIVCIGVAMLAATAANALWELNRIESAMTRSIDTLSTAIEAVDSARAAQQRFKTQVQEWKNILLRGADPEAYEKHLKGFSDEEKVVAEKLQALGVAVAALGIKSRIDAAGTASVMAELGVKYREALKLHGVKDAAAAHAVDKAVKGIDRAPTEAITRVVTDIRKFADDKAAEERTQSKEFAAQSRRALAAAVLLAGALLLAGAWWICRSIQHQVQDMRETAGRIAADNDLTRRFDDGVKNEIGDIATAVNAMLGRFQSAIAATHQSALDVDQAARSLSASSAELSQAADAQSEQTGRSAAAIEQLTVAISSVSEGSEEVRLQADRSSSLANAGSLQVGRLVGEIREVETAVRGIATSVDGFVASAASIARMTQQVQEIASRTNLLALNAAIEAARAGEQGRGFAVVADEVRQLAERSAVAASEIERLAGDIEVQSKQVQGAVTQGLTNLDRSTALTGEVESAIADTGRVVDEASQGIAGIAASVQEEKAASTEIAQSMEQISAMSEEASGIASATRATAQHLEQLAARLTGTVGEFRFA